MAVFISVLPSTWKKYVSAFTSSGSAHKPVMITVKNRVRGSQTAVVGDWSSSITDETDDLRSFHLTLRLGFRLRNNTNSRILFSNLFRIEFQNFWYSDNTRSNESRIGNRLGVKVALNNPKLSIDRTLYLMTDGEVYYSPGEKVRRRFLEKVRLRFGLGYRYSSKWRSEILYQRDWSRSILFEEFDVDVNALILKVKRVFWF